MEDVNAKHGFDASINSASNITRTNAENHANKFMNSNILNSENSKTVYQSSSFTTTINKDGNLVTEEKVLINNNGDKSESHRIITKDKDGNEIIKDVPKNKKLIKYNI